MTSRIGDLCGGVSASVPFSLAPSGMESIRPSERAPPTQGSRLSPVPQQPFFSPLSAKPPREERLPPASTAQMDDLPPLQSMLDLNAGAEGAGAAAADAQQAAAAATAAAAAARPPVGLVPAERISADGPCWVTVFGYHNAAMIPQVLQELRPSNGEIAQHRPGAVVPRSGCGP